MLRTRVKDSREAYSIAAHQLFGRTKRIRRLIRREPSMIPSSRRVQTT